MLATLTVNSVLDNTTAGDGFVTLREAILAANADGVTDLGETGSGADTIVFDPVVFATPQSILMSMGEFQISQALTIDGTGKDKLTINAQVLSRIFNVTATSGVVTLDGMKLTGGKAAGDGGAIRGSSSDVDLVVTDCLITGNSASNNGGGILSAGSIAVSGSSVTGNSVVIGNISGIRGLDVTVTNSTISGGVSGTAAVQVSGSTITSGGVEGVPVTITDSKITGQVLSNEGNTNITRSALYNGILTGAENPFQSFTLTINDSTIQGTVATGLRVHMVNVTNTSISGGSNDGIDVYSAAVNLNSCTISGSKNGIRLLRGSVTLNNSQVLDNSEHGISVALFGHVTLNNSTVERNQGGGVVVDPSERNGSAVINGSMIRDNGSTTARSFGGIWAPSLTLNDSIVSGNHAFVLPNFPDVGGGIGAIGATISNSEISGNSSNLDGGGVLVVSSAIVSNSTISGNSAGRHGGGIYAATVSIVNSTISGNTAGSNGGGIYAWINASLMKYSTIVNNQAAGGGGIWNKYSSMTIQSSIVAKNTAGSNPDLRKGTDALTVSKSLIGTNAGTTLVEAQTPDANGNLIGSASGGGVIDPLLGPLADNGGPTKTHALLVGSPAIDRIAYVPPVDPVGVATHEYQLNGSLTDAQGGPALVALGGIPTASGYQFNPNQGLTLSAPDIPAGEYSIEIVFSWDGFTGGWQKILDFKNLTSDQGLYTLDDGLLFQDGAFSADRFVANQLSKLVLVRDDASDEVRAYINGVQVWNFSDAAGDAVFSGPDRVMRFFQDDTISGQAEAQGGFVDRIRVFDRVLTNAQIAQMAAPPPPPDLPASDQRGYPYQRIADGDGVGGAQIDMGAFEYQVFTPAALPGDYNLDGTVDAADYTVWRNLLGLQVLPYSYADGNANGTIDAGDYEVWKANFGLSLPAAGGGAIAASVTEELSAATESVLPAEAAEQSFGESAGLAALQSLAANGVRPVAVSASASDHSTTITGHRDQALIAWLASQSWNDRGGSDSSDNADPVFDCDTAEVQSFDSQLDLAFAAIL